MIFSDEQKMLIKEFMNQPRDQIKWDNPKTKPLRDYIKEYLQTLQDGFCCYCQDYIKNDHLMTIDIEHILPKAKEDFYLFILEIENLALSCRRCNFPPYKGQKTDFLTSLNFGANWKDPSLYKFIHPRFENFEDHIQKNQNQKGTQIAIYYEWDADDSKAKYHFEYFKLNEIECDAFTDITKERLTDDHMIGGTSIFDELQEEDL